MNHTKIKALLNESNHSKLLNEKKKKGFFGKVFDIAKAGALGYLGYKAFKNRAAIGDALTGFKKTTIDPLRQVGISSKMADSQEMLDAATAGQTAQQAAIKKILDDPSIPADEKQRILGGMGSSIATTSKIKTDQEAKLKELKDRQKNMQESIDTNTDVKNFINELGQKNYSEADKYLKKVVEDKLQSKIKDQYTKQKLY